MIGPTDIQIILGKVRPLSRPHPEAHPQVLIIAQDWVLTGSTLLPFKDLCVDAYADNPDGEY